MSASSENIATNQSALQGANARNDKRFVAKSDVTFEPISGTEWDEASDDKKFVTKVDVSLEHISGEEWDEALASFDGVCQEQLFTFSKNRWPSVVCEPLLFRDKDGVVGGVLILIQPLPMGVGAVAVSKWGPLLKDVKRADGDAIYVAMVEALIEEYGRKRSMMISVLPGISYEPDNNAFDYLISRGFREGSQFLFPDRYVVNLRLSDEDQRKSFAQKWRYHLNKSMKEDLEFEHAAPERLEEFDTLYQSMTDRKKFADHSAYDDTITPLMEMADDYLRPELFFVRHEGELVAGALIFKAGDTAVYLYGATNDRALPLRAGYFLHWNIIRWLRDNTKATWYDLGGTDGFQGLHQFKKGMVGDAGIISPVPPMANYAVKFWPFLVGSLAFTARDSITWLRRLIEKIRLDMARPNQGR